MYTKLALFIIGFFILSSSAVAGSIVENGEDPNLKINVKDFDDLSDISNYTLTIYGSADTLEQDIMHAKELFFTIDTAGVYTVCVQKENYKTCFITWEFGPRSAEAYVEFHLPKLNLSRKELRKGKQNSDIWVDKNCDWCGGFKKMKKSYSVARAKIWSEDSISTKIQGLRRY